MLISFHLCKIVFEEIIHLSREKISEKKSLLEEGFKVSPRKKLLSKLKLCITDKDVRVLSSEENVFLDILITSQFEMTAPIWNITLRMHFEKKVLEAVPLCNNVFPFFRTIFLSLKTHMAVDLELEQ